MASGVLHKFFLRRQSAIDTGVLEFLCFRIKMHCFGELKHSTTIFTFAFAWIGHHYTCVHSYVT